MKAQEQTVKPGSRLRCQTCGTEVVVVRAADPVITCCGAPVEPRTPAGKPTA